MLFRQLFDRTSCTYTYLLADEDTREAVIIDAVDTCVERDIALIEELGLTLVACVDTHVHADHITAACRLRQRLGCKVVMPAVAAAEGADVEVGEGDRIPFGRHHLEVRPTPGHTEACTTYVSDSPRRVFSGDTLFVRGCGRTDFQGGSASTLYDSVHNQILSLPDETPIYPGHDYNGRTMTTVGEEKRFNPRLGGGRSKADFIAIMAGLNLAHPKLIDVAVPANLKVGACET